MKEDRPFGISILSWIAIRWLRSDTTEQKKELIATKKFILKAERKYLRNPLMGIEIESTFSIHRKCDNSSWRYEKYIVYETGRYVWLRSGKYPYEWE